MNRQPALAALILAVIIGGCGGTVTPPPAPNPPGAEGTVEVGPLLIRTAATAGLTVEEMSSSSYCSFVAVYGARIDYMASRALLDRIVFSSDRDGYNDIWMCNLDGSHLTQITNNDASDVAPAFSPDGTMIVLQRTWSGMDPEIVTIGVDGSGPKAITSNTSIDADPTWSPDGRRIAFESIQGNYEIMACYADGSDMVNLTNNIAADIDPDWAHRSTNADILFSSNRGGDYDIYRMNNDGTNQTLVINNSVSDFNPVWEINGWHIAWQCHAPCEGEIFVATDSGGERYNLTNHPDQDEHPAWSSDGRWIAFSSNRAGDYDIWLQETERPWRAYRVTTGPAADRNPHLGSPTVQIERVLIGPAGSDWGGYDPVWSSAYAGIVAFDDEGYRNFVRIGIRTADLGSLRITPMTETTAAPASMSLVGVLIEANEIVNLRQDAGRGAEPILWNLDPLDAGVVVYLNIQTGEIVSVLCVDDSAYPSAARAALPLSEHPDGEGVTVTGQLAAIFDAEGNRTATTATGARIGADGTVTVLR